MSTEIYSAVSQVYLHPLVIASVCDFYTRVTNNGTRLSSNSPVLGLLFGMRDINGNVTLEETTDVLVIKEKGKGENSYYKIDEQDLQEKITLWETVYPHLSLMGWYNFSTELTQFHIETHNFFLDKFNKMLNLDGTLGSSFVFLLFNSAFGSSTPTTNGLPLSIYLREPNLWLSLPYRVEGTEMEKITLDHLLQAQYSKDLTPSEVVLVQWKESLEVLKEKISLLKLVLMKIKDSDSTTLTNTNTCTILRSAAKITKALTSLKNSIPKEHQIITTTSSPNSYSSLYSQIIDIENKAGLSELLSGFSKADSYLLGAIDNSKKNYSCKTLI